MYVHLGGEMVVAVTDVVAILDRRLLAASEINQEFVDRAVRAKRIRGAGITPACRALVVTADAVYTSGISAPTLARRMTHLRQSTIAWEGET